MLLSYTLITQISIPIIILSVIIGSLGGLNQTSLRKVIAFSSINHIGWMIAAIRTNNNLWIIYFAFYSFISIVLIIFFNSIKSFHINQIFLYPFQSNVLKFCLFINFLSLGGLPPFLGFTPKWLVIQTLSRNLQLFLLTIIVLCTIITLFFYLRITFSAFMLNYPINTWKQLSLVKNPQTYLFIIISFLNISGLILITIMPLR